MTRILFLASAVWLVAACADVTAIDAERSSGRLEVLKDWFTSAILIEADGAVVLFDGGFRRGTMERRLSERGLALSDVTDVFLTHGHPDHLAVVPELDATVHAFEEESALIAEESDGQITIDVALQDGDRIDVGDTSVEVFHAPGHTAGSAVFLVEGVLVLGDSLLQSRGGELIAVAEKRSDDPEQLVASMRALADRLEPRADEIDWLAPSHSAWLEGFGLLAEF